MNVKRKPNIHSDACSSDSDDDVNMIKLKSAMDPDFQLLPSLNGASSSSSASAQVQLIPPKVKSNRKVMSTEWEAGHFVHPLKLTKNSQEFVFKQLFDALDNQIKGVKKRIVQHEEEDDGIYLFHASSKRLSGKDLKRSERKIKKIVQKKPKIEKRKIESDGSSSDEDSKLKSVAVSSDWVLNPISM